MPASTIRVSTPGLRLGGRLDAHLGAEQNSRHRDRPQQLLEVRLQGRGHLGLRLGPEVLDDHLLDVTVLIVKPAQGEQRFDTLEPSFANPDQESRGEGHRGLSRESQRFEPTSRYFVRRSVVRFTLLHQSVGHALEHDAHGCRDRTQHLKVFCRHQPGVQVRQEIGLLEHEPSGLAQVGQCRLMPQLLESLPSSFVAQFRLVAEREESFLAAHGRSSLRLFDQRRSAHERRLPHLWRSGEDAVVADVAAEVGQGEEDLLRIADEMSMARVAKVAGHINQSL